MESYRSKKDLVVEAIREAILSGELEPGERLLQEDLAERLKVSPTPVREALRQLEAEGALEYSPNKGVRVAEVNLQAVHEIYLIRAELEGLATRMAVPHLRAADVRRLKALHAEIQAKIESGELRELRKLNYDLHMLIYKAAGMPELFRIIRGLWTKFPWDTLHVLPNRASMSAHEHAQLIEAIERGDGELAGQLMQAHIDRGAQALKDYLSSLQPERSGESGDGSSGRGGPDG